MEQRQNGKIALMSAFDMYVSAQPDGRVECNRREAPPGGWEEFTVEYRSDYVVCLKSCHGKYLSAQKDGPEWRDWTVRQEADAQDIQIEPYRTTGEAVLSEPILNSGQKYVFAPEHRGWHWHNERARGMGGTSLQSPVLRRTKTSLEFPAGRRCGSVESERIGTAGNLCRTGEAVKLAKWARALKTGTGLMADLGHTRTGGLARAEQL